MDSHLGSIAELNDAVRKGTLAAIVRRDETRQIARIRRIAERVVSHVPFVRLVLIAGPSSAGKTTTAIRLLRSLRANGRRGLLLSTDNYFVGDARNPRDASGEFDYETIKAVDVRRLVKDVRGLLAGHDVFLRKFDFMHKCGYDDCDVTSLSPNGIVVIEGIHALNPALTKGLPESLKFRVYLNVFTQLTADSCEVLFSDDIRLLRRIVRDAQYRNESPAATIRRWPSVERGELKWINPFRRLSDAVFNTALDYELAVLKPYALKALRRVKRSEPEYAEAARLRGILSGVDAAPPDFVPGNSILREAIGGSALEYV